MGVQDLSGYTFGQYELRELLGTGGMGAVYRAYQAALKREVAIKVLPPGLASEADYLERFNREAETAASLEHPHIIPLYDYGVEQGTSYIVMRLLAGGTLADRIAQRAARGESMPSLGETAHLLNQIASAFDYAHDQGVVHRDIKPSNIMFDNQGNAFVVDFGIAKLLAGKAALTATGMVLGTPLYMAPEQWRAEMPIAATDQYALGVTIYQLVTGTMPFEAPTPFGLMHKHLNETPPSPHSLRPEVPEAITTVLQRAMSKHAIDRFPTVTAFAQAFEAAIAGRRGEATQFLTAPLVVRPALRPTPPAAPPPSTPRAAVGGPTVVPSRTPGAAPAPHGDAFMSGEFMAVPPAPVAGGAERVPLARRPAMWGGVVAVIALLAVIGVVLALSGGGGGEDRERDSQSTSAALGSTQTALALLVTPAGPEPTTTTAAPIVVLESETPEPLPTTAVPATTAAPDTATAQPTATASLTLAPSATPEPSATAAPSATAQAVVVILDTPTSEPSATSTPSATPEPSATAAPSVTPEPSATSAPSATAQAVIVIENTATPEPTETLTATPTATDTPSPTPSATPTVTPTDTPTATATETPSVTPSPTETPTPTATATPSATPTATEVPNLPPAIAPLPDVELLIGEVRDVPVVASDPDGDPLTLLAVSDSLGVGVVVAGPGLIRVAANAEGQAAITVSVQDGRGGMAQAMFAVIALLPPTSTPTPTETPTPTLTPSVTPTPTPSATPTLAATATPTGGGYGQIAFISQRDGNQEVYVMGADGSNPVRLTSNSAKDADPAWSPDGSRLVFWTERDGNAEIYVMNADGSGQRNLTNHPASDYHPTWSPDGAFIAFNSNRSGNHEVYVMASNGSNLVNLTNHPRDDGGAAWSPDGTRIVFTSNRDGNGEIYVMNADGSGVQRLTYDPSDDNFATWSPDARQIAFSSRRGGSWDVYVMNADGSDVRNLTNATSNDWWPEWSADGQYIAFASDRAGIGGVYLVRADGSDPVALTGPGIWNDSPAWRPLPGSLPVPIPGDVVALPASTATAVLGTGTLLEACVLSVSENVNVRSGPGTGYAILGSATAGQVLPVTGIAAGRDWWRVTFSGQSGWVSGQIGAVRTSGACDAVPVVAG